MDQATDAQQPEEPAHFPPFAGSTVQQPPAPKQVSSAEQGIELAHMEKQETESKMAASSKVDPNAEIQEQKFSVLHRQETKSQTYDERMTMEFEREFGKNSDTADLVVYKPVGVLFCFYFVYLLLSILILPRLEAKDTRIYPAHREFLTQGDEATLHEDMRRSLLAYQEGQNDSSKSMHLTFSQEELTTEMIFFQKPGAQAKVEDNFNEIQNALNRIKNHPSWSIVCKQDPHAPLGVEKCADDAIQSVFDEPEFQEDEINRQSLIEFFINGKASKYFANALEMVSKKESLSGLRVTMRFRRLWNPKDFLPESDPMGGFLFTDEDEEDEHDELSTGEKMDVANEQMAYNMAFFRKVVEPAFKGNFSVGRDIVKESIAMQEYENRMINSTMEKPEVKDQVGVVMLFDASFHDQMMDLESEGLGNALAFGFVITILAIMIRARHPLLSLVGGLNFLVSVGAGQFLSMLIFGVAEFSNYYVLTLFAFFGLACDNTFFLLTQVRQASCNKNFNDRQRTRITFIWRKFVVERGLSMFTIVLSLSTCLISELLPIKDMALQVICMCICHYCITSFTLPAMVVLIENNKIGLICLYDSSEDRENYKKSTVDAFFGYFWTDVLFYNRFFAFVLALAAIVGGLFATLELKEITSIQLLLPEKHWQTLENNWISQNLNPRILYSRETIFAGIFEPDPYQEPSKLPFPKFDPLFNITDPRQLQHFIQICDQVQQKNWTESLDCWPRRFIEDQGNETHPEFVVASEALDNWAKDSPLIVKDLRGRISAIKLEFQVKHSRFSRDEESKMKIDQDIKQILEDVNATHPIPIDVYNSGGYDLAWSKLDSKMINTVMQAIVVSFAFNIAIYLVFLQNAYLTLIGGILSLGVVVITFTFTALDSSNLGLEGTFAIIPIMTMSSTYISQLVCSYTNQATRWRKDKVRMIFFEGGTTVVSGIACSILTSIFLLQSESPLIEMFGYFTLACISVNFFVSLVFTGVFLQLMGPEDGRGDMTCLPCQSKEVIFMSEKELEQEAMETSRKLVEPPA